MQQRGNDVPISQRSAFGRMMAAKRTSGVGRSVHGDSCSGAQPNTSVVLPVIRQSQEGTISAPIVGSQVRSPDVADSHFYTNASSNGSHVITAKTSRGELLAIITQLQADLTQRTDSVNAIQRNFERLSAMHYAEQLELQRLRVLETSRVDTKGGKAEQQQLEGVLEEMRHKARVQETTHARLKEQLQAMHALCSLQKDTQQLIASHADSYRDVVQAEAAAYSQLSACSVAERTTIGAQHDARHQQMLCRDVTKLVMEHHAQIVQHLARDRPTDSQRVLEPPTENSIFTIRAFVQRGLWEAATLVGEYISFKKTIDDDGKRLHEAEYQRLQKHLQTTLEQTHLLRLRATEEAEMVCRNALFLGALQVHAVIQEAFLDVSHLKADAAATLASSSFEMTSSLLTQRVSEWCDAADTRLHLLRSTIEASMAENEKVCAKNRRDAVEEMLRAERERLQALHKAEKLALQADWCQKQVTLQQTHTAQLTGLRGELEAQLAAAEDRRVAAELQNRATEAALIRVNDDHAAQLQSLKACGESAVSDAMRACDQRWTTLFEEYRRYQISCTEAVVQLCDDFLLTRLRCVGEEEETRADIYRDHWYFQSLMLRDESVVKVQCRVTTTVLLERMQHYAERETASRALVCAAESAERTAFLHREGALRAQVHHALDMSAAVARVEGARAEAAEQEKGLRLRLAALEEDLRQASASRLVSLNQVSDAAVAAREAQVALERTQKDFDAYRSSVIATAHRIEVAERATESACCCPLCLRLYSQPVACVPCGHIFCAGCLLRHVRNRSLSNVTSSLTSTSRLSLREEVGAGTVTELELAQWLHGQPKSHARLFCPECASASVSMVVELQALGDLTAKYNFKRRNIGLLLAELR